MPRFRSPAQPSEDFAVGLLLDREGSWRWAIIVEVQKVWWRGSSFLFLLSRSGHPSTNDRIVRSILRSLYPLSGPCSSGSSQCSLVISVVSCLSSFALAFPYYCLRKALSERLAGSLKLMRYHQPFPFLSRQQRRGGVEFWSAFGRCLFWLSDGCIPAWGSQECHWCAMV